MNGLGGSRTPDGDEVPAEPEGRADNQSPPSVTLQQRKLQEQRTPATPDVRLYHRAVVVAQEATGEAQAWVPHAQPALGDSHELLNAQPYRVWRGRLSSARA